MDTRRWIYGNLGRMFLDVPRLREPAPAPDPAYARTLDAVHALGRALARAEPDAVSVEQVRLFVNGEGGIPAPPYGSWYLDGSLLGPSTALVAEAYAAQCLETVPEAGQPPDFIATELEFLHFLCRHQDAAAATRDAGALVTAGDAERRFLHAHFFRWVPRFARAIRHADPSPVFARVADVLECFCAEDAHRPGYVPSPASADAVADSMGRFSQAVR